MGGDSGPIEIQLCSYDEEMGLTCSSVYLLGDPTIKRDDEGGGGSCSLGDSGTIGNLGSNSIFGAQIFGPSSQGGSSKKGKNSCQPKSPARQQCEKAAQQKLDNAKAAAATSAQEGFLLGVGVTEVAYFGAGCIVGGLGSVVALDLFTRGMGAEFSWGAAQVGCFTGGTDAAANGLVPAVVMGGLVGSVGYQMDLNAANAAFQQDMQVCSTIR